MGRRRRMGFYRKRVQTSEHADAVSGTEPTFDYDAVSVTDDPEVAARTVAEITACRIASKPTDEEIAERELDMELARIECQARTEQQRQAREAETAKREASARDEAERAVKEERERLQREYREKSARQQADRQAGDDRRELGELRRRTAQQGIEWNAFKVGVQSAQKQVHINQLIEEIGSFANPPRDLNAERIAALEAQLGQEPEPEDAGWGALRAMGPWW